VYGQYISGGESNGNLWPEGRRAPSGDVFHAFLMKHFIQLNTFLAQREMLQEVGDFGEQIRTEADYGMCLRLAFHFLFTLHHRESPGAAAECRRLRRGETGSLHHGLLTHCPWLGQDRRCGSKAFPDVDGTEDVPLDGDEAVEMDGPAAGGERSRLRPCPDVGRADSGREGVLCSGQGCDKWMRTPGEARKAADARPSRGRR